MTIQWRKNGLFDNGISVCKKKMCLDADLDIENLTPNG
jgi:hypothetical protein